MEEGHSSEATCTISASDDTYEDVEWGRTNPQMAFLFGKVKVSDIGAMLDFAGLFHRFRRLLQIDYERILFALAGILALSGVGGTGCQQLQRPVGHTGNLYPTENNKGIRIQNEMIQLRELDTSSIYDILYDCKTPARNTVWST